MQELALIRQEIAGEKKEVTPGASFLFLVHGQEIGTRFQQESRACGNTVLSQGNPTFLQLLLAITHYLGCRVCYIECKVTLSVSPHTIQNHKMVLVPMKNTRKIRFLSQLFHRDAHAESPHTDTLGRITDTKHRHTLARDKRPVAQRLQGIVTSVILSYHAQACRSAVHRIKLGIEREIFPYAKYPKPSLMKPCHNKGTQIHKHFRQTIKNAHNMAEVIHNLNT